MKYERDSSLCGVTVQAFHTDNVVFTYNEFMELIFDKGIFLRYSWLGAPHQNGVAERSAKMLVCMAITMLTHDYMRILEVNMAPELWPMSIYY